MTGSFWKRTSGSEGFCEDIFQCIPQISGTLCGMDTDPSGFEWINADDADRSIFSFVRKSPTKRNNLLVIVQLHACRPSGLPCWRSEEETVQTYYG